MKKDDIIFLNKVKVPKMWGNEDWVISAHENKVCSIKNGPFAGKTLQWLWENQRELFGNIDCESFPMLTKVITAEDDLSIQVHPDDVYAKQHEGSLGKTECWYIIDCVKNAEITLGHTACSKDELVDKIRNGKWLQLLYKVKIKPGDFYHIPAGTVHGIGKGTVILETQQPSDVTYRLYDYDRLENGLPRQLHLEDSINVINVPHRQTKRNGKITEYDKAKCELLVKDEYFTVFKMDIAGQHIIHNDKPFLNVSVVKGEGYVDNIHISANSHFIIPKTRKEVEVNGNLELIISHV
ncbi:mannose-6-phosphate isomerase, class I [Proteinivorax hydrogeniformans]|uniref:mannose-6-phosphate isomerase n=1 Tax=Proteinivorax hydrogeniformans TaxID=1826727 RepID=A0AAU8HUG3_9FIRM